MTVIIFLIILAVLVLSHEIGHFVVAKLAGIRVDEFGLGLPPKATGKRFGETLYSLNWIPFGGFVRIHGEDGTDFTDVEINRAFTSKPYIVQAAVVVAGVFFNILLALLVIWIGFVQGLPASVESFPAATFSDVHVLITGVLPGSPAADAKVPAGARITRLTSNAVPGEDFDFQVTVTEPEQVSQFMSENEGNEVTMFVQAQGRNLEDGYIVVPRRGIAGENAAVGISIDKVGLAKYSLTGAVVPSVQTTAILLRETAKNMYHFVVGLFTGAASLENVSGPVGIAAVVGTASREGFSSLLYIVALISLSLAVVNLIPFPALDGGRLLFIIIEAVRRKPMPKAVTGVVNTVGFVLLILLMVLVTYQDIAKLIHA